MSPTRQADEGSTKFSEKGRWQLLWGSVPSGVEERGGNDSRNGGTNSITRTSYAMIIVSDKCFQVVGKGRVASDKEPPADALVIRNLVQFPISIKIILPTLPISQAWPFQRWPGAKGSSVSSISLLPCDPNKQRNCALARAQPQDTQGLSGPCGELHGWDDLSESSQWRRGGQTFEPSLVIHR